MKKILVCNNLIGDSLYLLKPLDLYLASPFAEECVGLIVLPQLGGDIIRAHFKDKVPIYYSKEQASAEHPDVEFLHVEAGQAMHLAVEHHAKTKQLMHLSQCYAFMLGVDCEDNIQPPTEWIPKFEKTQVKKIAVIGPFSKSCARHSGKSANKTLDDWKWEYIIRFLRKHDFDVQCVGAPDDFLRWVSLPISSYRSANNLEDMLRTLSIADVVITVDSGTGHVSSACETPTIIMWSSLHALPPQFIAPLYAKKTMHLMIGDPNKAEPAHLLFGIKKHLEELFKH